MSKLVVANLKSFLDDFNVENYAKNIKNINYNNLVICPQDKYLDLIKSDSYKLGLQDFSDNYTKVEYILLGHYDRRKDNETDEMINEKVKMSLSNNLKVILCIGNNKDDDYEYIYNQINICLKDISKEELSNIILAYEPFYMIGNDLTIDINEVNDYISHIKEYIKDNYNFDMKILYGGNVNELNVNEIIEICDGILVGRVSFDVDRFTQILQKISKNQ